jgi:hypothetical protein
MPYKFTHLVQLVLLEQAKQFEGQRLQPPVLLTPYEDAHWVQLFR